MTTNRCFKKALITGISGSGGSYLAEVLLTLNPLLEIHGISRWHSTSTHRNLDSVSSKIHLHECDLNDFSSVFSTIQRVQPDVIFHLAAHANVRASFITPLAVLSNNIMGTANLLESLRLAQINPIFVLCSTSEVYGQVNSNEIPILETQPLRPASPYAVSKVTQDLLGGVYFKSFQMNIIRTRMFAYLNPRRLDLFATSFAYQVARIEKGLQQKLFHGNLDSVRTLLDVRDAMESYWIAALRCMPGEIYNIGGTTVIKVGEFLEILKKMASCQIPTEVDPHLLRPSDVTLQIPSTQKFYETTGWKPKISFEESVQYLLNYWRMRVHKEV